MSEWSLYYNPRCGTCVKVKERLEARGVKPRVIEYLKEAPSVATLKRLLEKMGAAPAAITRFKEPYWQEQRIDPSALKPEAWLKILSENPFLIQRPIVETETRALVARPPEEVDTLF
ncbi:MAG: arsenate reductase (glutaredoxin) [Elusimicrobia bacterium]|nr:arsenate reductase (glutaredoxin) [Elusimicrobiota bacterium]